MNASITLSLALIAIALPFLVSIIVALRPSSRPRDISDYFLYQRHLSPHEFLRASMGYSLQAAAVSLFLYWGIKYGPVVSFVAIAWGLGYYLVVWALRRGYLNTFLGSAQGPIATIHGYVASQAKAGRVLILVLACSTIFGLGGTLIAEMDYASAMVHSWLGTADVPGVKTFTHLFILSFTCLYILWGGYRAAVDTDRLQVPLAYLGFGLVVVGFYLTLADESPRAAAVLSMCTAVLYAVLLLRRVALRRSDPNLRGTNEILLFGALGVVSLAVALLAIFKEVRTPFPSAAFLPPLSDFAGFGVLGVVALILANSLWQFIDISSLQRLQSLEAASIEDRERIAKGLRIAGVEAAAGWLLVVILAVGCRIAGIGDTTSLGSWLTDMTGLRGQIMLPALVFTVVIFAITTIDTFLSAIAYVVYYDVVPSLTRQVGGAPTRNQELQLPRVVTIVSILVIYVVYMGIKSVAQEKIDAVLYGVYAVQIAIAPVVCMAIFKRAWLRPTPAIVSVVVGWFGALVTALTPTPPPWISPDSWVVMPPLVAVIAASGGYLVALPVFARADRRTSGRTR